MLTTGCEMSGYSRIDSRSAAITPRISSSSDSTVANTGRRIESSESRHDGGEPAARLPAGAATGVDSLAHRRAVAQLQRALDDHAVAGAQAGDDLDEARLAAPSCTSRFATLSPCDHVDELPRLLGHQRLLRHHQRIALLLRELDGEEHAGLQRAVAIGHQGAHRDRARSPDRRASRR